MLRFRAGHVSMTSDPREVEEACKEGCTTDGGDKSEFIDTRTFGRTHKIRKNVIKPAQQLG